MTYMNARSVRIGFVTLTVTILAVGMCGNAVANARKGRLRARSFISENRERESAKRLQLVSQESVRLGPMRYFGGPKSPMWREVR
jgi:hypothetical protein